MLMYRTIQVRPQGKSTPFFQADLPILPPSVNGAHVPTTKYVPAQYKKVKGQYRYTEGQYKPGMVSSVELRQWNKDSALLLPSCSWTDMDLLKEIRTSPVPLPLSIHFNFFHAVNQTKADTDNRIKYGQDAVFRFLKLNDNLVDYVSAMYCASGDAYPHTEIEVSCYTQE